jgi:hypothetical protein
MVDRVHVQQTCAGSVLIGGLSTTMRDERVGLIHPTGTKNTLQTEQETAYARWSELDG